jgi:uncharacterized RDD family membrane protein YckC
LSRERSSSSTSRHAVAGWSLDEGGAEPRGVDGAAGDVAQGGLALRGVAFLFDMLVVQFSATMVLQAIAFVFGVTILADNGGVTDQPLQAWVAFGLPAIAIAVVLAIGHVYLWRVQHASPGQLVTGLFTVRMADGGTLSRRQALVRWLMLFLPAWWISASNNIGIWYAYGLARNSDQTTPTGLGVTLPVVWYLILALSIAVSRNGRGLHDRAAGSVVVYRTQG